MTESSIGLFGGGDAAARFHLGPGVVEHLLQRREECKYAVGPAVVAHQADAPGLALEVAETAADLDAEFAEQPLASRRVVHAVRDSHGVQLRQLVPFPGDVLQTESRQAGL